MSKPIPLRDFVAGGHVTEETVNAIAALNEGEAMVTEDHLWASIPFRCWTRRRLADGSWTRSNGQCRATVQEAAEDLLGQLHASRCAWCDWPPDELLRMLNARDVSERAEKEWWGMPGRSRLRAIELAQEATS